MIQFCKSQQFTVQLTVILNPQKYLHLGSYTVLSISVAGGQRYYNFEGQENDHDKS
jgi:hypothetical protein